jgi:hypothetical protein
MDDDHGNNKEDSLDHNNNNATLKAFVTKPSLATTEPIVMNPEEEEDAEAPSNSSDASMSDNDHNTTKPYWMFDHREFRFTCVSNGLFLIASCLYLILSVYDYQWEKVYLDIPSEAWENEETIVWSDYGVQDDYVFQTPRSEVWVSQYIIVYFSASVAFVLLGILEWILSEYHMTGVFFILAGFFGVLASLYVEKDEDLSSIFDLVSCGLFFFEAIRLLLQPPHRRLQWWLRIADGSFILGATLDVITSLIGTVSEYSVALAAVAIFSSSLWLLCAMIYTYVMVRLVIKGGYYGVYIEPDFDSEKELQLKYDDYDTETPSSSDSRSDEGMMH